MRLSTRIALAVGVAMPLLVLAAGWLQVRLVSGDLHEQQDAHLQSRAEAVADDARGLLRAAAGDRPNAERARERQLFGAALDVGLRLTGPEGIVAEGGPRPGDRVRLPDQAPRPVTARGGGTDWRVLSVPLGGARAQTQGTLWLFAPDTASREQLATVRRRVRLVAALAAPVGGLLAWGIASSAARPLRRLQQRAGGLDPRDSRARLAYDPTGVSEVDDLARTVQTVLARYDEQAARTAEALATARAFSAAASHELRTPLMSMRTNLDVLVTHPDLGDPDRAEVLTDLHAEHARMLGLLVMLRQLAEGDLVDPDTFGPVELAELAEAEARGVRARHPGVRIEVTGTPLTVHGWEPGLRSTLANLLANAAVHGRTGDDPARIDVTLRPEGGAGRGSALLTVDDQGPGIAAADRDRVFHRFRHRPGSPGSGLGLTLVAQQVALHGGTVRVLGLPAGQGARFEVRLPLDGPDTRAGQRDWLSQSSHKNDSYVPGQPS